MKTKVILIIFGTFFFRKQSVFRNIQWLLYKSLIYLECEWVRKMKNVTFLPYKIVYKIETKVFLLELLTHFHVEKSDFKNAFCTTQGYTIKIPKTPKKSLFMFYSV